MMKNKKIILSILFLVLLAYLVMAAAGDQVRILSPSPGANFTSISAVLFNVSFHNNSDIQNPANATFFLNISGTWARIGNTSAANGCQTVSGISTCGALITNLTIPDGIYSVNATLYNATAGASISVKGITNLSHAIYIDGTRPLVFAENFSNPSTGGNYSQNLAINLSAIDATIGIQSVFFNITNATSGLQNATVTATLETGTRYSTTINTTGYVDGYYNLTAFVNDSLNNLNNSGRIYQLIFDNTLPSANFTCEDLTVVEDEEMDCDCDSGDALSGVLSEDFDPTPPTSTVGNNLQSNCTVTDRAGNIRIDSISYDVAESSGGSSSGSSGSGTSSGTTTGGTTTNSSNNSTNQTTTNTTSGSANQLSGNQENQNSDFKLNYWILSIVVVGIAIAVTIFVLIKKGLISKILEKLKYNKPK